jgi:ferredoxin
MPATRIAVVVDHDRCVGNRMCSALAPGAFRVGENGQSDPYNPEGESLEAILDAAGNCPMMAIRVSDAESDELLFP